MLRHRYSLGPTIKYGLLGGKAYPSQAYHTLGMENLWTRGNELDALIVGGGSLLRTDWGVICDDYAARIHAKFQRSLGYQMRRLSNRFRTRPMTWTSYARRKFMRPTQRGPFIIHRDWLGRGTRLGYFSIGAVHEFAGADAESIRLAMNGADSIYVRDDWTASCLDRAGVTSRKVVAPDVAVLVSRYWDRSDCVTRGRKQLQDAGLDPTGPTLIFQCNRTSAELREDLIQAIHEIHGTNCWQVVCLPIGHCLGDVETLAEVAEEAGNRVTFIDPGSVEGTIDLIASADAVCATSMHAGLTAFSFERPLVVGPIAAPKMGGFIQQCGLPDWTRLKSWSDLKRSLHAASTEPLERRTDRITRAAQLVDRAVDHVMNGLQCGGRANGK